MLDVMWGIDLFSMFERMAPIFIYKAMFRDLITPICEINYRAIVMFNGPRVVSSGINWKRHFQFLCYPRALRPFLGQLTISSGIF